MDAYAAQWKGSRPKQEDAYAVRHFPDGSLLLVCDGMGGHSFGELASASAAESFVAQMEESADSGEPLMKRMEQALHAANAAVHRISEEQKAFGGTTLLACYVSRGLLRWVSVGDSPLYLWRRERLVRLNEDHSMRPVYAQYLTFDSLNRAKWAGAHTLRSALMGDEIPMIDAPERPYPLLPGDRLIICSDGLDTLVGQDPMPPELRNLLNRRGGNLAALLVEADRHLHDEYADNVTVLTMDV